MTTTVTRTAEPTPETLASMVKARALDNADGCVAVIQATDAQCQRTIDTGALCTRHHKVALSRFALNRFAKAVDGKRKTTFANLTQTVTVAVADLHALLLGAPHGKGVTVRLRSASIGMFEIGGLSRNGNGTYNLGTGHCLNNSAYSRPSIYPFMAQSARSFRAGVNAPLRALADA